MAQKKEWREGEMILTFGLTKVKRPHTPLMQEWLDVEPIILEDWEAKTIEKLMEKADNIGTWSEEDLKMKFISPILALAGLTDDKGFVSFFDKKLAATVQGHPLVVKADFVVAKGLLDFMQRPFFHFQEYKPEKNPTGDPMAQLLEAFLIGQTQNDDGKPLYGCEVVGKNWVFVAIQDKTYCVSKAFDSTERNELLYIIAVLRKFRTILNTRLL
jgi:hypothetical protein